MMRKLSVIDEKSVGNILKVYRKSNRMTQQRVAEYLGVSRSAYSKYETMRIPELDVIIKLSVLYGISLDEFLSTCFTLVYSGILAANSPDSEELQVVTDAEKKLLEYYRGCVRKADMLRAAEEIYNSDIEIISDINE